MRWRRWADGHVRWAFAVAFAAAIGVQVAAAAGSPSARPISAVMARRTFTTRGLVLVPELRAPGPQRRFKEYGIWLRGGPPIPDATIEIYSSARAATGAVPTLDPNRVCATYADICAIYRVANIAVLVNGGSGDRRLRERVLAGLRSLGDPVRMA